MHKKLERLDKEKVICIVEDILEEMKKVGMTAQYNMFMDVINEHVYSINKDEAMTIVRNMRPYGEVYNMDTVKNMIQANGVEYTDKNCIRYYLCMNMYANDAKQVAEENNMPVEKFCFVMAKSFINDIDGDKHKVEKYFTEVV